MRRVTLDALLAAKRRGTPLVRALNLESGEERLIDPAAEDESAFGRAAFAACSTSSQTISILGSDWLLSAYSAAPWEIVIVGAVHIAQALTVLAKASGFRVRVIDPRNVYATEERFPGTRLVGAWPEEALKEEPLSPQSALAALAHDPKIDDPALAIAVRSPAAYVGALGSSRTQERRTARLADSGFSRAELSRINGPVGLAIGARTPSEIAIAILAQIVQVKRAASSKRIGGIILAAGQSTRMGTNKLLLPVNGKPLLRHAVDAAILAALDPIVVVTGHQREAVQETLSGLPVTFAYNADYAEGLSASLRAGIAALPTDCEGAAVLLGDMPAVSAALIRQLISVFDPDRGRSICVAAASGSHGHPVLWAREFFEEITALHGDTGAKSLLTKYQDNVCKIESSDDAPLLDIDTPAMFARFVSEEL